MAQPRAYGQTRERRASVTYAQIERAATDILKAGVRPTLEGVRSALGGGSPKTILDGLNRYWRDLGSQIAGQPNTLQRMPAQVADLAEGLWHQALTIATSAVQATTTEAQGALARLKCQIDLRAHTLSHREVELDELVRAREYTVKELQDHLRATLFMLSKKDATIQSLEKRLDSAHRETASHRDRLAALVQRSVFRQRHAGKDVAAKARVGAQTPARPMVKGTLRRRQRLKRTPP